MKKILIYLTCIVSVLAAGVAPASQPCPVVCKITNRNQATTYSANLYLAHPGTCIQSGELAPNMPMIYFTDTQIKLTILNYRGQEVFSGQSVTAGEKPIKFESTTPPWTVVCQRNSATKTILDLPEPVSALLGSRLYSKVLLNVKQQYQLDSVLLGQILVESAPTSEEGFKIIKITIPLQSADSTSLGLIVADLQSDRSGRSSVLSVGFQK